MVIRISIVLLIALPLFAQQRDPKKQPFSSRSIWNIPIGSKAVYAPANIQSPSRIWPDEDIIILTPNAPRTEIYEHNAGWDRTKKRCESITNRVIRSLPIPSDFFTDDYTGLTPNQACAVLGADGRTLYQNQPFHRCSGNGTFAVTQYEFPPVDLYGDGIPGSHGGSGLSGMGGTLRLEELVPGGRITHALKLTLWCFVNCYYSKDESDGKPGFRWPAIQSDNVADSSYQGTNVEVQMGSLLALLPDFDVTTLQTEPGKIIATTLRDYGAYIVDDAAWDCFHFATEWSPEGRVKDEFQEVWGYGFLQDLDTSSAVGAKMWLDDIRTVCKNLHVVRNNNSETIGGGGTPRRALAPELDKPPRPDSTNLVRNGAFVYDKELWNEELGREEGYQATFTVKTEELCVNITSLPKESEVYKVQVKQIIDGFLPNTNYDLQFTCRGTIPHFVVQVMNNCGPKYEHLGIYRDTTLSVQSTKYVIPFTSIATIPDSVRLSFSIGSSIGNFYLDDVVLTKREATNSVIESLDTKSTHHVITVLYGRCSKMRIPIPKEADHLQLSLIDVSGRQFFKTQLLPATAAISVLNNRRAVLGTYIVKTDAYFRNRIISSTTTSVFINQK